jgi:pimeloyl-ACP methyl ester carboxylesterase
MQQTVTFDDGATTTLESWGTSGPAVLCIHGITSSRKSWERTAEALSATYRVFAYDQRGHGDSAHVKGPMTLERSLADLRAVAAAIGGQMALIGHSWGGAVAILGGREPFADRVVAVDPMIRVVPGTWRQEYLEDVERDLALPPAEREAVLRKRLTTWHERDVAGKIHAMRTMSAEAIARLGSENRVDDGKWDLRSVVAGYPKPLLILAAGPGDSVISPDDMAFVRAQGGSHVRVEVFEDQGHNLHRTAFDRYIAAVKEFLKE